MTYLLDTGYHSFAPIHTEKDILSILLLVQQMNCLTVTLFFSLVKDRLHSYYNK